MKLQTNQTIRSILANAIIAAVSLFVNGLGVYLTIHANIGAGPIMQLAFQTVRFDATTVQHQRLPESIRVISGKAPA